MQILNSEDVSVFVLSSADTDCYAELTETSSFFALSGDSDTDGTVSVQVASDSFTRVDPKAEGTLQYSSARTPAIMWQRRC